MEIREQRATDALAELTRRDEEMMNETIGFPNGEKAEEGSVRAFGEVDDFSLGIAGKIIELEVARISSSESEAAGAEVEIGKRLLVGGKGGTEKHGAQEAFVMEPADVEEKMTRRGAGASPCAVRVLLGEEGEKEGTDDAESVDKSDDPFRGAGLPTIRRQQEAGHEG
jgi:hypothetical protein